jgi:hypothetical protein
MLTKRLICAGLVAAAALSAPASWAMEPGNDFAPWTWRANNGDATLYSAAPGGSTYNGYESISSTSDVDYIITACGTGKVQSVSINFASSPTVDLDIVVYDLSGNYLGASTGTGSTEFVNLSAISKQVAVMKVYSYQGTATYNMSVVCG